MFDVVQVILKFLAGVFCGCPVTVLDLCPAGNTRLHNVPLVIIRQSMPQFLNEPRNLRPWPDKAHGSFQHVQQLGKFILSAQLTALEYAFLWTTLS